MADKKPPRKPQKPGNPIGGVRAAAHMLSGLDSQTHNKILENVAKRNPKLAAEIQGKLFTFEDLTRLSTWDIQNLLKKIPQKTWALALRNAPQEIRDFVFKNLSTRAGAILEEEIRALGPRRLSEIEAAQAEIVNQARDLLSIDKS